MKNAKPERPREVKVGSIMTHPTLGRVLVTSTNTEDSTVVPLGQKGDLLVDQAGQVVGEILEEGDENLVQSYGELAEESPDTRLTNVTNASKQARTLRYTAELATEERNATNAKLASLGL